MGWFKVCINNEGGLPVKPEEVDELIQLDRDGKRGNPCPLFEV